MTGFWLVLHKRRRAGGLCIKYIYISFCITFRKFSFENLEVQDDQLYITVCLWYLVKIELSSVPVYSSVHWTRQFLQGARQTRSCLCGRVVLAYVASQRYLSIYRGNIYVWNNGIFLNIILFWQFRINCFMFL